MEAISKCLVCKGDGKIAWTHTSCPFCNETGEYSKASETFLLNHICQCIISDRKNCPVCEEKCHHDTHGRPKVIITGGMY
jgi:RecJ-like exonuclease